jgi:hypothetical protein
LIFLQLWSLVFPTPTKEVCLEQHSSDLFWRLDF